MWVTGSRGAVLGPIPPFPTDNKSTPGTEPQNPKPQTTRLNHEAKCAPARAVRAIDPFPLSLKPFRP